MEEKYLRADELKLLNLKRGGGRGGFASGGALEDNVVPHGT